MGLPARGHVYQPAKGLRSQLLSARCMNHLAYQAALQARCLASPSRHKKCGAFEVEHHARQRIDERCIATERHFFKRRRGALTHRIQRRTIEKLVDFTNRIVRQALREIADKLRIILRVPVSSLDRYENVPRAACTRYRDRWQAPTGSACAVLPSCLWSLLFSVRGSEVVHNAILTPLEGAMATPLALARTLGPDPSACPLLSGDYPPQNMKLILRRQLSYCRLVV